MRMENEEQLLQQEELQPEPQTGAAPELPPEPQTEAAPAVDLAAFAAALRQGSPDREETFRALQQREAARVFREDLAAIRAAWPDEKAESIAQLGPQFAAICAAGVEPLAAYEALRAQRQRRSAPSTGPVAAGGGDGAYFSRDEVARMSREEIHRNFDSIRRSMRRW